MLVDTLAAQELHFYSFDNTEESVISARFDLE